MGDDLEDELRRMLAARGDAVDSNLSGASIRERAARRHDDPRHRVLAPAAAGALLAVAALVTPFLLLRGTEHPTHRQPTGVVTPLVSGRPQPAPHPSRTTSPSPHRSTRPTTGATTLPPCTPTQTVPEPHSSVATHTRPRATSSGARSVAPSTASTAAARTATDGHAPSSSTVGLPRQSATPRSTPTVNSPPAATPAPLPTCGR